MTEPERHHHSGVPVFGLLLVIFGAIFLLQTLEILPWSLWNVLWRLWPVLLIVSGLELILRRWNRWLVSTLVALILVGSVLWAIAYHNAYSFSSTFGAGNACPLSPWLAGSGLADMFAEWHW